MPRISSFVPRKRVGAIIPVCPSHKVSTTNGSHESIVAAESSATMEEVRFADTIVAALGGSKWWWPLFLSNGITLIETDLLRSTHLKQAAPPQREASFKLEVSVLVTLWQSYIQVLTQNKLWDNQEGDAFSVHVQSQSSSPDLTTLKSCSLLSDIIGALQQVF